MSRSLQRLLTKLTTLKVGNLPIDSVDFSTNGVALPRQIKDFLKELALTLKEIMPEKIGDRSDEALREIKRRFKQEIMESDDGIEDSEEIVKRNKLRDQTIDDLDAEKTRLEAQSTLDEIQRARLASIGEQLAELQPVSPLEHSHVSTGDEFRKELDAALTDVPLLLLDPDNTQKIASLISFVPATSCIAYTLAELMQAMGHVYQKRVDAVCEKLEEACYAYRAHYLPSSENNNDETSLRRQKLIAGGALVQAVATPEKDSDPTSVEREIDPTKRLEKSRAKLQKFIMTFHEQKKIIAASASVFDNIFLRRISSILVGVTLFGIPLAISLWRCPTRPHEPLQSAIQENLGAIKPPSTPRRTG